jgi:hypothetical protein
LTPTCVPRDAEGGPRGLAFGMPVTDLRDLRKRSDHLHAAGCGFAFLKSRGCAKRRPVSRRRDNRCRTAPDPAISVPSAVQARRPASR